jgi:hypothetical protein
MLVSLPRAGLDAGRTFAGERTAPIALQAVRGGRFIRLSHLARRRPPRNPSVRDAAGIGLRGAAET